MQSRKVLGLEAWKPALVKVKGLGMERRKRKTRVSNMPGWLLLICDTIPMRSMIG